MRPFFSGVSGKLFLINSITACAYAFLLPIMSLYLIDGLGADPVFIAYYNLSFAISGIIFSQWFGHLSDRGVSDRHLFMLSVMFIFLSAISFSQITSPWQAVAIAICLMGPGNACVSLIFSMIKRFAEQSQQNATKLNVQMRMGVSMVWVMGPAVSFSVASLWGYTTSFMITLTFSAIVLVLSFFYLPTLNAAQLHPSTRAPETATPHRRTAKKFPITTIMLGLIILLGNLANHVYVNAMPLYLTQEITLPKYVPGLLLALTAFCEVPVMLWAGTLATRYGHHPVMRIGFFCAIVFYVLIHTTTSLTGLFLLQIVNALYYGTFAGLGISLIQNAFPDKGGFASAFYTNMMRIGMMTGASLVGVVAQYTTFATAMYLSVGAALLAFCLMTYMTKQQPTVVEQSV